MSWPPSNTKPLILMPPKGALSPIWMHIEVLQGRLRMRSANAASGGQNAKRVMRNLCNMGTLPHKIVEKRFFLCRFLSLLQ